MNQKTLDKLQQNKHYKISAKQLLKARDLERKPMVQFGEPEINSHRFDQHETQIPRVKRKSSR